MPDRDDCLFIPPAKLKPSTLEELARSHVLSEGTDYGHEDWPLQVKVDQVLEQIWAGQAVLCFSPKTETFWVARLDSIPVSP